MPQKGEILAGATCGSGTFVLHSGHEKSQDWYQGIQFNYPIVWIPKYRRRVLTGPVKTYVEELIPTIATEHGMEVLALEVQPDHIHLFASAPPRYAPSRAVNLFKGIASRRLRHRFPHLRRVHKDKLWTRTYYVGSAGQVSAETIKRYIAECQPE
jgi:putative transposase